jgi:tripartite-type tricarboxylate transporter receptor subunit TctC
MLLAASPKAPFATVKELIDYAKKNPGKLFNASSSNGSPGHVSGELFKYMTGTEITHIPYKGGAPAIAAVVAGDAQLTFGTPPSVLPMVQAGRLKALAVTSPSRTPLVPNVPGTEEAGLPAYSLSFWYGLYVPAGTPAEISKKLFDAAQEVLRRPEVSAALAREGAEVAMSKSPEEFAAFLVDDNRFWAKLVKDAGVKAE